MSDTPFVTAEEFNRRIHAYPWFGRWAGFEATSITRGTASVRVKVREDFLRHGKTWSGPIVMGLADVAMYAAVMGVSTDGEGAVTSDMNMHFLRRPTGEALVAEARVIRQGRRLIVCEVDVFVEGEPASVCRIVGTYAVPVG